tara:strand:+ start:2476 stop:2766 length:291 start_codon:yes stop_codon:yes gene_type:complete
MPELNEEVTMQVLTNRLEAHLKSHEVLAKELDERIERVIRAQELNATNIADLTTATQGVVEAWTVANGLSKFLKWLSSFAIIGGIYAWLNGFIKLT